MAKWPDGQMDKSQNAQIERTGSDIMVAEFRSAEEL
jgi:hypothetical protein